MSSNNQSKVDYTMWEGSIAIVADKRRGLWAFQSSIRGNRPFRNAGTLPTVATSHTLLSVALMTGLRDVSRSQAAELVRKSNADITRPRILVTCLDATFVDALQGKILRDNDAKPFKLGRNFVSALAQQVARFTISFQVDAESTTGLSLRNWAERMIPNPKDVASIAPCLLPTAVSVVM